MVKIVEAPYFEGNDVMVESRSFDVQIDDIQSVSDLFNEDYRQNDLNVTAIRDVCCCCCPCCSCCAASNVDPFENKIW